MIWGLGLTIGSVRFMYNQGEGNTINEFGLTDGMVRFIYNQGLGKTTYGFERK